MRLIKILFSALMLCAPVALLADFEHDPLKQGWHWYPSIPTETETNKAQDVTPENTTADPVQRIAAIRKELDRRKAQAVLEPSEKNILSYITYQNEQLDKAGAFSDQFRRVVWTHPELDYNLKRPTSNLGKRVWLEQRQVSEKNAVQALGKRYGLFFFFRSDCPYCHRFAPVLKDFAERQGLTVIPISLDGVGLPEYPNPQLNNGQFEKLSDKQAVVPAVLAVEPSTQKVIPISFGFVAQDELQERIYVLTQVGVGHDY